MIENVMYVEELLHNLQYELMDIGPLDPTDFVNRLLCYPLIGFEDRLLAIIRQAVHEYQNERVIMKYLRIVDKLTKVPTYKAAIHTSIVDIYCEVFLFLHLQKCSRDLEELKILRKYWLGNIHPYCLSQMKDILLSKTNIDIDNGIKPEMLSKIKHHYATKLNMTPEEIALHFPLPKTNNDQHKFSNQRYILENKTVYPANHPQNYNYTQPAQTLQPVSAPGQALRYPQSGGYSPYANSNTSGGSFHPMGQNVSGNTQVMAVHGIQLRSGVQMRQQMRQQLRQVQSGVRQLSVRVSEETKRKRLASEETRAAAGLLENDPRPRKIQHREEVIIDYKSMLCKLNEVNQHHCKECGMLFATCDNLELHKNQHFKDKLLRVDRLSPAKGSGLCSGEEWLRTRDQDDLTHDRFQISQCRWPEQTAFCVFCCSQLTMQFKHDQWVFVNATVVSIEGRESIMHKSCQWVLQSGSTTADSN